MVIDTRAEILLRKRSKRKTKSYLVEQERVKTGRSIISLTLFVTSIVLIGLLSFSIILLNFQVAQNQLIINEKREEINYQSEIKERLNFRIAQLQSPQRIYEEAVINLGMSNPDEINYINIDTYQLVEQQKSLDEDQDTQVGSSGYESFFNPEFKEDVYKTILTLLFP